VPLKDEDYLILYTVHSAKGQEIGLRAECGGWLHALDLGTGTSAEIEEERRLLYVAMTRAKDNLHLMVPHRFFTYGQNALGDRHVYAARSRFIPHKLLSHFEHISWPVVPADAVARPGLGSIPRMDVGAKMRNMWR
jgi:DNA helicase II / ATP-dependent DNA helicase PcrA